MLHRESIQRMKQHEQAQNMGYYKGTLRPEEPRALKDRFHAKIGT
jgi:hypothetical protein